MVNATRRRMGRLLVVVLIGLLLGALLSELAIRFMPDSSARTSCSVSGGGRSKEEARTDGPMSANRSSTEETPMASSIRR